MDSQPNHSREDEALLLAVHAGDDPAVQTRLEQLLSEGIDWTVLVRSAIHHRLVPLLKTSLLPIGAPRVPGDISQALGVWADRNQRRQQVLERAVVEISSALQEQGIEAIFLRGPALAQLAYGSLDLQEAVNPAVLLRVQDLARFHALLTAQGYKSQPAHADTGESSTAANNAFRRSYVRVQDESICEVYTAIVPSSQGIRLDLDALREQAADYDFGGAQVRTLSLQDLVLVWSVTGSTGGWPVLGELCDIASLLRNQPEIDLRQVRARARGQGVERLLLLGLGLAQQALGLSIDAAVIDDPRVRRMLPVFSEWLLVDDASEPRPMAVTRLQLQLRDRWSDRSRYLMHSLLAACRARFVGHNGKTDSEAAMTATARNKAHWSKRSDAWEKWSGMTRPRSAEISRALITAAGVDVGHQVLDLACGVGDTSLELSPLVGPGGFVMTTDLAFDMVARARWRALADDLTNLHFCTAAMESLPFGDRCFDGIVCRLGIMYCPHVQRALAEARRVLRPGARAAFLVCGQREDNPILKNVNEVATELFELEKRDADIDPFRFGVRGSLAQEMVQAGYLDVTEQEVNLPQRARVGTRFWQPGLERGMSLSLEDLPQDTQEKLEQRMTAAFEPFLREGFYELPSLSRITWGTCPE